MQISKVTQQKQNDKIIQNRAHNNSASMEDNRTSSAVQRAMIESIQRAPEEEELTQGKFVAQRASEEEELTQGKFVAQRASEEEEETLQGKFTTQRAPEEEELTQGKFTIQRVENNTGIPDNLKSGMENLSGMSMDHVKVHYNSPKPAAVQAHAYAQGSDIHIAGGQEKHLPHELGHVVQQAQGRVQPTTSVDGMAVNDNPSLESEATSMGEQALQRAAVNSMTETAPLQYYSHSTEYRQNKRPFL